MLSFSRCHRWLVNVVDTVCMYNSIFLSVETNSTPYLICLFAFILTALSSTRNHEDLVNAAIVNFLL